MLVSAHEALLARLVLKGKASEEDRKKFAHKVWGSSFARGKRSKSEAEYMEQAATMLEVRKQHACSGIMLALASESDLGIQLGLLSLGIASMGHCHCSLSRFYWSSTCNGTCMYKHNLQALAITSTKNFHSVI
jgi:hypothetical protein